MKPEKICKIINTIYEEKCNGCDDNNLPCVQALYLEKEIKKAKREAIVDYVENLENYMNESFVAVLSLSEIKRTSKIELKQQTKE